MTNTRTASRYQDIVDTIARESDAELLKRLYVYLGTPHDKRTRSFMIWESVALREAKRRGI
jgi:hypothetical protein